MIKVNHIKKKDVASTKQMAMRFTGFLFQGQLKFSSPAEAEFLKSDTW